MLMVRVIGMDTRKFTNSPSGVAVFFLAPLRGSKFSQHPLRGNSENLGSPSGVAANMSCTSEHNLKEQSDAQIVVSR